MLQSSEYYLFQTRVKLKIFCSTRTPSFLSSMGSPCKPPASSSLSAKFSSKSSRVRGRISPIKMFGFPAFAGSGDSYDTPPHQCLSAHRKLLKLLMIPTPLSPLPPRYPQCFVSFFYYSPPPYPPPPRPSDPPRPEMATTWPIGEVFASGTLPSAWS